MRAESGNFNTRKKCHPRRHERNALFSRLLYRMRWLAGTKKRAEKPRPPLAIRQ